MRIHTHSSSTRLLDKAPEGGHARALEHAVQVLLHAYRCCFTHAHTHIHTHSSSTRLLDKAPEGGHARGLQHAAHAHAMNTATQQAAHAHTHTHIHSYTHIHTHTSGTRLLDKALEGGHARVLEHAVQVLVQDELLRGAAGGVVEGHLLRVRHQPLRCVCVCVCMCACVRAPQAGLF